MCLNVHTHQEEVRFSGLNNLRMPGSVGLKTHFHKGSGDFWWALVIVFDILLKCIHTARIMCPKLRGKYFIVVIFLPLNFLLGRHCKITHNSSIDTWPALLWNVSYWTHCNFERPASRAMIDHLLVRFHISELSRFSLFFPPCKQPPNWFSSFFFPKSSSPNLLPCQSRMTCL